MEHNIFDSTPAHEIIEELSYKANTVVAEKIVKAFPEKAFLRRHAAPKAGRLQTFAERMTKIGYEIDTSNSGTLQNSLFKVEDANLRKVSTIALPNAIALMLQSGYGDASCEDHV